MLHSIYDSSVPPLPIPKNYQKEYSLRLLLHFIVLRLFVEGRMRHWPRAFHFRYEKSTPRNRLFSKCRCTLGWTLGCFSNFENIDGEYFDLFKYSNCMRSSTLTFLLLSCQPYSWLAPFWSHFRFHVFSPSSHVSTCNFGRGSFSFTLFPIFLFLLPQFTQLFLSFVYVCIIILCYLVRIRFPVMGIRIHFLQ